MGFVLCPLGGAALRNPHRAWARLFLLVLNRPLEKLPLRAIFARWIAVAPEFFRDFRLIQARLFSYFTLFAFWLDRCYRLARRWAPPPCTPCWGCTGIPRPRGALRGGQGALYAFFFSSSSTASAAGSIQSPSNSSIMPASHAAASLTSIGSLPSSASRCFCTISSM